jgi:hypothetical protein
VRSEVKQCGRDCDTLKEAAESDAAPYFYECFLKFAREKVPFGDSYDAWKQDKARAMGGWTRHRLLRLALTPPDVLLVDQGGSARPACPPPMCRRGTERVGASALPMHDPCAYISWYASEPCLVIPSVSPSPLALTSTALKQKQQCAIESSGVDMLRRVSHWANSDSARP